MRKILVFSDSHGDASAMKRVIEAIHPDAEYVLHLGDGMSELESLGYAFPRIATVGVSGNCDWMLFRSEADKQRTLDIDGVRIFMCHGHNHGVRSGDMDALVSAAIARNADVVLYGHTHCADSREILPDGYGKSIKIMNPGSISRPRGGMLHAPSYGVILLGGGGRVEISLCEYAPI